MLKVNLFLFLCLLGAFIISTQGKRLRFGEELVVRENLLNRIIGTKNYTIIDVVDIDTKWDKYEYYENISAISRESNGVDVKRFFKVNYLPHELVDSYVEAQIVSCTTNDNKRGYCEHKNLCIQRLRNYVFYVDDPVAKSPVCAKSDICCPYPETIVENCTTPLKENGQCIFYRRCPAFLRSISKVNDTTESELFEQNKCGKEDSHQVCCTDSFNLTKFAGYNPQELPFTLATTTASTTETSTTPKGCHLTSRTPEIPKTNIPSTQKPERPKSRKPTSRKPSSRTTKIPKTKIPSTQKPEHPKSRRPTSRKPSSRTTKIPKTKIPSTRKPERPKSRRPTSRKPSSRTTKIPNTIIPKTKIPNAQNPERPKSRTPQIPKPKISNAQIPEDQNPKDQNPERKGPLAI